MPPIFTRSCVPWGGSGLRRDVRGRAPRFAGKTRHLRDGRGEHQGPLGDRPEELSSGHLAASEAWRVVGYAMPSCSRYVLYARDRGMVAGRLGIEERAPFVFSHGVAVAAPAATITSATPVTAGCRMVKDAHELELMRLGSRITLRAYQATYAALREGMGQTEVAGLVASDSVCREVRAYRSGSTLRCRMARSRRRPSAREPSSSRADVRRVVDDTAGGLSPLLQKVPGSGAAGARVNRRVRSAATRAVGVRQGSITG